jgi:heme A synthase
MQRQFDFQINFITSVILISVIIIVASFFEMRIILKRNLPHTKIFTWQPVVVTLLYLLSLLGGLIRVKIGYFLLGLSFIVSLFIYRFFSTCSRSEV